MTPLDDELRRTLNERASVVAPPADPLEGIEARARGIRRRRAIASATGAALAVAAIAVSVPLLTDGRPTGAPDRFATSSPDAVSPSGALDPRHPWAFRGTPLEPGTLDAFTREWQAAHPGGSFTPLWSQVYEPNRQVELVFLGSDGDAAYVGWGAGSESGPELRQVERYDRERSFFQFTAPGDEGVTRLYVVGAPGSALSYAQDGTHFTSMAEPAASVGVVPLEGDTSHAQVRVAAGPFTYTERAKGGSAPSTGRPANAQDWEVRGQPSVSPSVTDLKARFAEAVGRTGEVVYQPLFVGDTDSGVRFTVGQAWIQGDSTALTVSYATGGTNGPELFVGKAVEQHPWGIAYLIASLPGTDVDLLVVVPRPGVGQVSYDDDASGAFRPVASGRSDLNGVALVDRSTTAGNDRLEVLEGDGNLDNPLYRGPVAPLLCGVKECG
jgi:hypothetical protein